LAQQQFNPLLETEKCRSQVKRIQAR